LGVSWENVRYVILTHHHSDHVDGLDGMLAGR